MKLFYKSCRPFKLHKMKKNKRRIKKYDDNLTSESSFLHPKWSIAPQFVESNNGWVAITSPEVFFSFFFLFFIILFYLSRSKSYKVWKFEIFLPLWFYVKTILTILEVRKLTFCNYWHSEFWFLVKCSIKKLQKNNQSLQNCNNCCFWTSRIPEIDFM